MTIITIETTTPDPPSKPSHHRRELEKHIQSSSTDDELSSSSHRRSHRRPWSTSIRLHTRRRRRCPGLGLVDGDVPPVEVLAVHALDRVPHRLLVAEGDESEAAGPPSLAIVDNLQKGTNRQRKQDQIRTVTRQGSVLSIDLPSLVDKDEDGRTDSRHSNIITFSQEF
ncbi:hypothetical protein EUGRSUZ_E01060 [Eucalyptus grandis]|uniref:Uncharacterized protein n=2 Tax=Eucalyptus grandis TaxID=71139 RepID=A0ACC3KT38_EUCGR|nr:hypothetical protein EUGRSUZ_E01060 [Eucalyptus grandis]